MLVLTFLSTIITAGSAFSIDIDNNGRWVNMEQDYVIMCCIMQLRKPKLMVLGLG